jgi:hypothetical protein
MMIVSAEQVELAIVANGAPRPWQRNISAMMLGIKDTKNNIAGCCHSTADLPSQRDYIAGTIAQGLSCIYSLQSVAATCRKRAR